MAAVMILLSMEMQPPNSCIEEFLIKFSTAREKTGKRGSTWSPNLIEALGNSLRNGTQLRCTLDWMQLYESEYCTARKNTLLASIAKKRAWIFGGKF